MSTTLEGAAGFARGVPAPRPRRRIAMPPLIALMLAGGVGLIALLPQAPEAGARVLASRELRPIDEADGALTMRDTADGAVAARIPAEGDSFVRGVLSAVNYKRRLNAVPLDAPLRLSAMSNGRVVLSDARTSTSIDLEAFGPDNLASFARMLSRPDQNSEATK